MNKLSFSLLILMTLISKTSFAEKGDSIEISADKVEIQESSGSSIYEGNARLSQGKDLITANKIIIEHPDQELKSILVQGTKSKAAYILLHLNKGKKIEGHARKITYNILAETLVLTGNVSIQQGNNLIKAQSITFNKKTQSLKATSNKNQRVVTRFEVPK